MTRMKVAAGIAGLAVATVLSTASEAHAYPKGFGEKGQLIITADRLIPVFNYAYGTVTTTGPNNVELTASDSAAGVSLLFGRVTGSEDITRTPANVHAIPRIAFDISVIKSLTIGAALAAGFGLGGSRETEAAAGGNSKTSSTQDAPNATAFGFVPRVGYVVPLNDTFAFWPRVGFGIYSVSSSYEVPAGGGGTTSIKATDTLFSLDLDPQFAIVPLEHFFIHAGPVVNVPLGGSRSASRTTGTTTVEGSVDASMFNFGVSAGLGGWFNIF